MTDILTPVPALHLPSAEVAFGAQGRVAFGSDAWAFWSKAAPGTRVWIVASAIGFPQGGIPGIDPGKLIFSARLAAVVEADRRHRHPSPALRPATTEGDGAWTVFFEVDELVRLTPPISVIGLRTVQGVSLQRVPQGPLAIRPPEALA